MSSNTNVISNTQIKSISPNNRPSERLRGPTVTFDNETDERFPTATSLSKTKTPPQLLERNRNDNDGVVGSPSHNNGSEEGETRENPQQQQIYYKSPNICCCDLQTALMAMAIFDILIGFICFVIFINGLSGPGDARIARRQPHYYRSRPYYRPRPYFYHHRPHYIFRRAANGVVPDVLAVTTTANTTGNTDEEMDKTYLSLGVIVSVFITIASVMLLIAATTRKKTMCWVSELIGWIIYLGAALFYCLYVFGSEVQSESGGSLTAIGIVCFYRIYETVVVYYFIKEPIPPPVRYVPTTSDAIIYSSSPQIIYEPSYVPMGMGGYGYGYGQPYGGYGYGGYGYGGGAGLGMATGLGLGLALGGGGYGGYHDHYDYCDGGYGYDY